MWLSDLFLNVFFFNTREHPGKCLGGKRSPDNGGEHLGWVDVNDGEGRRDAKLPDHGQHCFDNGQLWRRG